MSAQREFDIVLYGATGFAGKLTAEYLAKSGGDARIALAGRSQDKLLAVRETLGDKAQSWPLITADASQPSTLNAMAAQTQVVVTTVGPYARYGLPLVAACAAAGTDYADLTGETLFIRESIDLYHKQAADTGARIVHSCGFDSVPSDLTVFALYRRAQQDRSRPAHRHESRGARDFRWGFGRHRRLDDGGHARGLQRSGGPAGDQRPLHADPGPRCRARTRGAVGPALAAWW